MSRATRQTADGDRPLAGFSVVDFSQLVGGPLGAMILGDLGADVVKIEPPAGDPSRRLLSTNGGIAPYFDTYNRGKRSVVIDLRTERGLDDVRELLDHADVLIESFRPGVMSRLGLAPDEVLARNPRLVYASLSGFGQRGPNAARGGVDSILQAETGLMAITGEPDGLPMRVGAVPIDVATGHVLAQAVLAALLNRERTGRGDVVEISLYEVGCHLLAHCYTEYLTEGTITPRTGNFPRLTTPTGVYDSSDGQIVLAAYLQQHWETVTEIFGDDALAADPRFATLGSRVANAGALVARIQQIMRTRTTAEWLGELEAANLAAGEVRDPGQVAESEQFAAAEMALAVTAADGREVRTIRLPARFGSFATERPEGAPVIGADQLRPVPAARRASLSDGISLPDDEPGRPLTASTAGDEAAIDVRQASPSDAAALRAFIDDVRTIDRTFLDQRLLDPERVGAFAVDRHADGIVAVSGERVVGVGSITAGGGWSGHTATLRLVVGADQRGRGVGARLAGRLMRLAAERGVTKLVVEVGAANTRAVRWFERLGFVPEATLRDHVRSASGDHQDLVILAAWIDDQGTPLVDSAGTEVAG